MEDLVRCLDDWYSQLTANSAPEIRRFSGGEEDSDPVCALEVALKVPLAQAQPGGMQAAFAKNAGTLKHSQDLPPNEWQNRAETAISL